jgi:hypothetical protein
MIVALDVDGTITRNPPFFALLSGALKAAGHEVIILTFREDRDALAADLAEWGIAYGRLITATTTDLLAGGPDEWKARVCRELGVDVFFEDVPEVLERLDDSVLAFLPVDRRKHRLDHLSAEAAWE